MRLNRKELKKISLDFLSLSSRLLQADFRDYNTVLCRFTKYIVETDIIKDYINDCGECELDLIEEFKSVQSSRYTFDLGSTDEEEVRNITAILIYIVENGIDVARKLGFAYSSSTKFQDSVKAFNERVVIILINHIENYLTKVGIDMGVDETTVYNITIKNGQINIANDNAVIAANNLIEKSDINQLKYLVNDLLREASKCDFSDDETEIIRSSIDVIEEEAKSEKPRKSFIKTAIAGLKGIKGTAEFVAAIAALADFVIPLLG